MPAPPLRPYQQDAVDLLRRAFLDGKKRVILCAPTGAGKTRIFTELVYLTLQKNPAHRVLVVTDRIELFKQTYKAIAGRGVQVFELVAGKKVVEPIQERCVVAMVETLKNRLERPNFRELLGDIRLLIIDEAHKDTFKKTLKSFEESFVIGATATPIASKGNEPIAKQYHDIISNVDIPPLVTDGYLARPTLVVAKNPRIKDIKDDARTGEYDEKSHMAAFMDPQVYDNLVEAIEMYARDKKTIIFCNSIAETEGVTGMLKSRGHDAVYVTSEISPNNRKEALERFHEGDVKIMVNCGILTTGYDHPEIEVVVMYRATKSLPLWLQCCGRGSRVVPGVKEHFTIIDLGENARRLGHWEKNRDWTSIWLTDGRSMKDGVPPTKECPECQTDVHISVMTCPSCGYVFESKDDGKPKPKGTLEIVKSELLSRDEVEYILAPLRGKKVLDLSPRELYQFWTAKGHNEFFGARAAAKKGLAYLLEYAKVAGYTAKWASKMHHLYHDKPFNNYTV